MKYGMYFTWLLGTLARIWKLPSDGMTLPCSALRMRAQVMIAACDTFRSGAVEQLKTHCTQIRRAPVRARL